MASFLHVLYCVGVVLLFMMAWTGAAPAADADEAALRKTVLFYASFDDEPRGDLGEGDLSLWTRFEHETEKGKYSVEKGFHAESVRIAKGKGVQGGALEFTRALPRRGMLFFPAMGKLACQKGGWGGAVSVWLKPSAQTPFCDPVYITQRRWNDGALWFDYNHDKRGSLRMGAYPVLADGQKPPEPGDPHPSMARLRENALKPNAWNHLVLSWNNCDSGKKDGQAALFIDGKLAAEVRDLDLRLDWDLAQTRIHLGFMYLGLMDELAIFSRCLSASEAALLHDRPAIMSVLRK
jgi:hypothetical protein